MEAKGNETEREATSEKRKETLEGTWQLIDGRIQVLGDFIKFFVRLFYWIDKLRLLEGKNNNASENAYFKQQCRQQR